MITRKQKPPKGLIAYYGILQSAHLVVLIRAGILILSGNPSPFPILPPTGGWQAQTLPFMFGLAGMDVIGILLGIIFSYQTTLRSNFRPLIGIISLTIFISGAVIFGAGTFPSGAWAVYPVAYWVMVALFAPSLVLFYKLLLLSGGMKNYGS